MFHAAQTRPVSRFVDNWSQTANRLAGLFFVHTALMIEGCTVSATYRIQLKGLSPSQAAADFESGLSGLRGAWQCLVAGVWEKENGCPR